jgi:hypothetical protein
MCNLCMFIRYLVFITRVLKDNWCECGNLFIYCRVWYQQVMGEAGKEN